MLDSKEKNSFSDSDLQVIKARLVEWAEWYSSGQLYGLGYASPAFMACRQRGVPCLLSHAEAEEMEAWVIGMARHYPLAARALRLHYFHAGSLRAQAFQLAVSHTQVKLLVGKAHQWLIRRWRSTIEPIDLKGQE